MNKTKKIDVIIPTYHPDEKLERCLRMLKRQTIQPQRILLINTEEKFFHSKVFSTLKQGEIVHITKPEFDHGGIKILLRIGEIIFHEFTNLFTIDFCNI